MYPSFPATWPDLQAVVLTYGCRLGTWHKTHPGGRAGPRTTEPNPERHVPAPHKSEAEALLESALAFSTFWKSLPNFELKFELFGQLRYKPCVRIQ